MRLVLALVLLAPSIALAQADADRAYDEGRIEEARAAYTRALEAGADRDALHHVHLRLGVIAAVNAETEQARRHFSLALAIDPGAQAPSELAPAMRTLFDASRTRAIAPQAEVHGATTHLGESTLRITLDHPLAAEVARYRVRALDDSAGWTEDVRVAPVTELAIPESAWGGDAELALRVEALDAHGGVLGASEPTLRSTALPEVELAPVREPVRSVQPSSVQPSGGDDTPWIVGLIVGAIVLVGLAIGIGVGVALSGNRYVLGMPQELP